MIDHKNIQNALSNIGILIDEETIDEDIDLTEYILDSLQFVSFIIELENELNIELPVEVLQYDKIRSLNGFVALIQNISYDT